MEKEISNITKYGQLKEILKQEYILTLDSNTRILSIKKLMERYKLSLTTVDRAIRELVNEGYLYVQRGKGIFVKNKTISTKIIGVIEEYEEGTFKTNFHFTHLVEGILSDAYNKGCKIQFLRGKIKDIIESKIDSLILVIHSIREEIEVLEKAKIPYCYISNDIPDFDFNLITFDFYKGVFDAVSYFLSSGIKDIGLITLTQNDTMLNAYKDAYSKFNLNINESFIKTEVSSSIDTGYKLTKELFQSEFKPRAIVFGDDHLGQGGLTAFLELKIKVPDEVAVISLANSGFLFSFPVPIATMEIDPVEIGRIAFNRVIDNDNEEKRDRKQVITPKFIVKESCKIKI